MGKKYVVLAERDLTPDENLWLDIRADAIKKTPEAVVASLTRLLTLATALAGGALVALKDEVVTPWARVGASAFFFLALAVAGYGLLPSTAVLPPWPNHVRDQIARTLRHKEECAWGTMALTAIGLLVAILGAAVRAGQGGVPPIPPAG